MTQPPSDIEIPLDDGAPVEIRTRFDAVISLMARPISWLIFVAFVISVFEVISRYGFGRPTSWVHESTTFLVAVTFLVAGPIALARDRHIRVRIFYDKVSPGKRRILDIVNSVLALLFFGGLSHAAWTMSWKATHAPTGALRLERTGTAWNPPMPAVLKIVMLICVLTMAVQTILHLIAAIKNKDR